MRETKFRKDNAVLIISLWIICTILILSATIGHASDYNQQGQATTVTYTILDASGNQVSGQTVGLAVKKNSDGTYFDWNTGSFTATPTRRMVVMDYDSTDGFYNKVISFDTTSPQFSGDYTVIISNDNTTYKDHVADVYRFDNTAKLIRIMR